MLVIHWAHQNQTHRILKDGIRPACRRRKAWGGLGPKRQINAKGVYVFPFSRNSTTNSTWRRQLKVWGKGKGNGNMNGFVFKLEEGDFPLHASDWESNRAAFASPDRRELQEYCIFQSMDELAAKYGKAYFTDTNSRESYDDFEIIIPRHITSRRIIKIVQERSQLQRGPLKEET